MTGKHKNIFLHFMIRTGMYVPADTKDNITSFIEWYELGTAGACSFTKCLRDYLEKELDIEYSADGWPGQVARYAGTKNMSWTSALKQLGLAVIALPDGFDAEMQLALRSRIEALIERIKPGGDPWFNELWTEEWRVLCDLSSNWFRGLWTPAEYESISAISRAVEEDHVFKSRSPFTPSELLSLHASAFKKSRR